MKNIAQKIDKEIYNFLSKKGDDFEGILINSHLFLDFLNEIKDDYNLILGSSINKFYYRDKPLIRSFDLEYNDIIIF